MYIDNLAYTSKLKNISPDTKVIFSIFTAVTVILIDSNIASAFTLIAVSLIIILINKTPIKAYFKVFSIPVFFLVVGVFTIAIDLSSEKEFLINWVKLGNYYLGCTSEGLKTALRLLLKALAAVTCLNFLSLSTPMTDILEVMRKYHIPKLFTEILALIYRFIFIILETIKSIYISQNSRLGYINKRRSFHSMASLISSALIKSFKKSDDFYTTLESRGYTGEINVISRDYSDSRGIGILFMGIDLVLIVFYVFTMGGYL